MAKVSIQETARLRSRSCILDGEAVVCPWSLGRPPSHRDQSVDLLGRERCSGKTVTGSAASRGIATSYSSSQFVLTQHSRFDSLNLLVESGVKTLSLIPQLTMGTCSQWLASFWLAQVPITGCGPSCEA